MNSIRVSDKVAGYRGEVEGAIGTITGNQTAHAELDSVFVIIELVVSNKEDKAVSVPKANTMMLETGISKFYTGDSIFNVFQIRSRTPSTAEELNKFYCRAYPETLLPKSSEITCVIFHIKENEELSKIFHIGEKGKRVFAVNLR